ncbi:MAG: FAD-dependent oxidoreductase, partial [Firmicutes bacterium]|nr:FAD-dependent oxidoreductase [Bacillota bacterium]
NIEAGVFVDATGDADIAALAGVPCEKGRAEDGAMQPVSLIFRMANVDLAQVEAYMGSHPEEFHHRTHFDQLGRIPLVSVSGFFSIWRGAVGRGEIDIPRERILFFRGARLDVVTVNTTRILGIDGTSTSDLTRAEIEGRRQAWTVSRFLQKNIPGFEKAFLMDTGVQIGVRETRRIMGEYILTQEDILEGRTFPDDVARGAYSIDIHDVKSSSFVQLEAPEYGIPYRCLVPKKVENLLVAGRSISTTREAQASIRVTPTCMATGQAAGTAAAVSAMEGIKPREVSGERLHEMLQNQGVHF